MRMTTRATMHSASRGFSRGGTPFFLRLCHGVRLTLSLCGTADEAVADADDRLDGVAALAELRAQAAYVHVERARVAVVLLAPNFVQQLLARGDAARPPG